MSVCLRVQSAHQMRERVRARTIQCTWACTRTRTLRTRSPHRHTLCHRRCRRLRRRRRRLAALLVCSHNLKSKNMNLFHFSRQFNSALLRENVVVAVVRPCSTARLETNPKRIARDFRDIKQRSAVQHLETPPYRPAHKFGRLIYTIRVV